MMVPKVCPLSGFWIEAGSTNCPTNARGGPTHGWGQPLDIRPAEQGRQAIAQIAERARRVKRPRSTRSVGVSQAR